MPRTIKPTRQSGLKAGQIVRIPIDECTHTYGRLLSIEPYLALYDCRTEGVDPSSLEIVSSPVLFVVAAVYQAPVKEGRWVPLEVVPLTDFNVKIPLTFHQPVGRPDKLSINDGSGEFRPATPAECEGLERSTVWVPWALEERLSDHYQGKRNHFLEIFGEHPEA